MTDSYYKSRYTWDSGRPVVWKEIVSYLSKYIPQDGTVLDLGAGYCDFINNVKAKNKIAVDYSPDFKNYAEKNVKAIESPVTDLSPVSSDSVDVAFASNLFEHLTDDELTETIKEIKRVLKKDGKLILMQPNFRLSAKTYFDDPTHKKIFSDKSLKAFLISHDFKIELEKPRFLPFSLNSRPKAIPLHPILVRAYIHSPVKPFAGQMLFVAKK